MDVEAQAAAQALLERRAAETIRSLTVGKHYAEKFPDRQPVSRLPYESKAYRGRSMDSAI